MRARTRASMRAGRRASTRAGTRPAAAATTGAAAGGSLPGLDPLRAALALLTRLPVGPPAAATTGAGAFPIVGAGLGLIAALPLILLSGRDALLAAPLALALAVALDGALHLDGLADSADALAAPTSAAAERARTDPRIGAAGAATLVLVLAVDLAALALLGSSDHGLAAVVLVAGAAAGRGGVAVATPWLPVRAEGFGGWFGRTTGRTDATIALASLAVVAVVLSVVVRSAIPAVAVGVGSAVAAASLARLARRQDGATGDAFGAAIELGFAAALCAAALVRP